MKSFRITLIAAALTLAGCASLSPAPTPVTAGPEAQAWHLDQLNEIGAFSLVSRMAVRTEKNGFSGPLRWKHTEEGNHISLYSPLGAQVADIQSSAEGVTLVTNDRKTHKADSAEALLQNTMGWSLPLTGLSDWVLGRPTRGPHEIVSFDPQGRITKLKQNGWDIEYAAYKIVDGIALPGKVTLRSPQVYLKLLIDKWGILAQE